MAGFRKSILTQERRRLCRAPIHPREQPHRFAGRAGEIHLLGCAPNAAHMRVRRAVRACGGREAIIGTAIRRIGTRGGSPVPARRGGDDGLRLAPSVTAGRAEERGQHDATVGDEHLGGHASRTRMVDGHRSTRVGTPSSLVHVRRHFRFDRTPALVRRPLANHAAIRGNSPHVNLQDAAVFQREVQDLSLLRSRG